MVRRRPAPPTEPTELAPRLLAIPAAEFWRVHPNRYAPTQFNPGRSGNARFSPIHDTNNRPIPTLYASSTLADALMETVFHDVPTPPGDYILDLSRIAEAGISASVIRPRRALRLIDLSTKGLQRLGLRRTDLIDTPVSAYTRTRNWAQWFHVSVPSADGLVWTSRKDDEARSLMLFGDRVGRSSLVVVRPAEPLIAHLELELLELAEHIGIDKIIVDRP